MRLQLSECYTIVTDDSAAHGDVEECGFIRERETVTVREAIDALRECSELSSWPIHTSADCAHTWASTSPNENYRTGAHETRSIHFYAEDGRALPARHVARLYRAAGLIDVRL